MVAAWAASPSGEGSAGREGVAEGAAQRSVHAVTALVDAVVTQEVLRGLPDPALGALMRAFLELHSPEQQQPPSPPQQRVGVTVFQLLQDRVPSAGVQPACHVARCLQGERQRREAQQQHQARTMPSKPGSSLTSDQATEGMKEDPRIAIAPPSVQPSGLPQASERNDVRKITGN